MSDPFLVVALQFSLLFAAGSVLAWYVMCGTVAVVWAAVGFSKRQVSALAVHSREQVATLSQPVQPVHLTKKVKVAYK